MVCSLFDKQGVREINGAIYILCGKFSSSLSVLSLNEFTAHLIGPLCSVTRARASAKYSPRPYKLNLVAIVYLVSVQSHG